MHLLKGTFVLKIVAFACAIATYFYIHNEMYRLKPAVTDPSYKLIKLTAKTLPLKARLASEPPEGYQIAADEVTTKPDHVIVIGPEALLNEAYTAETAIIDISESTGTVTKRIPLESVAGTHLTGEPYLVEVTIPIRKIKE